MDEEVMQSPSARRPTGSPAIQGREPRGASDESLTVQMVLSNFYRREDDARVRAIEVASWLRVLSGRSAIDILAAWEAYQKHGPRDQAGRLIKPTPHDIERRIAQQAGKAPAGTGPAITEPMRKAAEAIIQKDRSVSSFWVDGPGAADLMRAGLVTRAQIKAAREMRRRFYSGFSDGSPN